MGEFASHSQSDYEYTEIYQLGARIATHMRTCMCYVI